MQTDFVSEPDQTYAEWYVWAKREVSPDRSVCLAAAQAAVATLAEGRDRAAAEEAARRSPFGVGVMLLQQVSPRRRAYAEWYDWARREVRAGQERWQAATRAAVDALEQGASSGEAAGAARAAADQIPSDASPEPEPRAAGPSGPIEDLSRPVSAPEVVAALPEPPARPSLMYGGLGRRLLATVIDGLVLALPCLILLVALSGVPGVIDNPVPPLLGFTAFGLLLVWFYFAGLESSSLQATLGKSALGIVVTDLRGRRISFLRASARVWLKFLFVGLSLILVVVDAVVLVLNGRKRGLHDLWSGSLVARREYVPLIAHQAEEQRLRRLTPPPPAYQGPLSTIEGQAPGS